MRAIIRFLRDNSLSLMFFFLFSGSIIGQSFSGASAYNKRLSAYGFPEVSYWQYLESGDFLDGVFVNWQAAVLQLGCLVVFAKFLRQRGASHSRKPEDQEPRKEVRKSDPQIRKGATSWMYRNSLSLAFSLVFLASIAVHVIFGALKFNHDRTLERQAPISTEQYILAPQFWFEHFRRGRLIFVFSGLEHFSPTGRIGRIEAGE